MINNSSVNELVDAIKEIVGDSGQTDDRTILCQVISQPDPLHYDLHIVPNITNKLSNVINVTRYDFQSGDYCYVYLVDNDLHNAFICCPLITKDNENRFKKQVSDHYDDSKYNNSYWGSSNHKEHESLLLEVQSNWFSKDLGNINYGERYLLREHSDEINFRLLVKDSRNRNNYYDLISVNKPKAQALFQRTYINHYHRITVDTVEVNLNSGHVFLVDSAMSGGGSSSSDFLQGY